MGTWIIRAPYTHSDGRDYRPGDTLTTDETLPDGVADPLITAAEDQEDGAAQPPVPIPLTRKAKATAGGA
jgi:hypothetical protein